jgi:hypothetical protein
MTRFRSGPSVWHGSRSSGSTRPSATEFVCWLGFEFLKTLLEAGAHLVVRFKEGVGYRILDRFPVPPAPVTAGFHFVRLDGVKTLDFVLLALPTTPSMEVAVRFLKAGAQVIDLGAAFRLRDRAIWERVYAREHAA